MKGFTWEQSVKIRPDLFEESWQNGEEDNEVSK